MASPLDKFKQDHPEYADASNQEAGRAMYDMYYKDKMTQEEFVGKLKSSIKPQQSAWTDVPEQIVAGAARGVLETAKAVGEYSPAGALNTLLREFAGTGNPLHEGSQELLQSGVDALPKADTMAGGITGAISQFAMPFAGASKAIKSAGVAKNMFARGMAAGAVADFSAFDPHEERLSNLLVQFDNPTLNNVVTQYLASDKEDSDLEGRLKQVLEGGILGAAAEPIVRGMANGLRWIKGKRAAKTEKEALDNIEDIKSTKPEEGEVKITDDDITKSKKVIFTHVASDADKVDNLNMSKYPMRPTTKGFLESMDKVFGTPVPKRSWATEDSIAKDMGMSPEDFIQFSKQTENAAGILAEAHSYLTDGVRELKLQADKIRGGTGTEDDLVKFTASIKQLANYEYAVKSMTATAGRTLNRLRGLRDASLSDTVALDEFLKGKQITRDHVKAVAEAISGAQTVGQARRMAKKFIQKPTRVDAALELYINSLLSGLRTQATNLMSTGTSIVWTIPERYIAAGIAPIMNAKDRLLGNEVRTNYATLKEANAYAKGAAQGAGDAVALLAHSIKDTGVAFKDSIKTRGGSLLKDPDADLTKIKVGKKIITDPMGKLELEKHQAFRGDVILGEKGAKKHPAIARSVDLLGEWVVRLPGRALYMGDSMMKTIGYRMELKASATRQAMDEFRQGKISKDKVDARINELFDTAVDYGMELPERIKPEDAIYKELHDNAMESGARYLTFTRQLGSQGRALQHFTSHPAMRTIVPFVRTPVNILKFTGERTPLAPASKAVRKELRSRTAKSDIQYARMVFSGLVGAGVYNAAQSGYFTGSFPNFDPEQKQRWYDAGLQPNSFVDKDGWFGEKGTVYSLSRLEPVATVFGIASDMSLLNEYMTADEEEHLSSMIVASISNNMTNKTYLKTLTDLAVTVQDPNRHLGDFVRQYASSIATAPIGGSITAHIAAEQDPYLKDARNLIDAIKVRIPYMRDEVPNRLNDYGEEIEFGGSLGPDIASPIFTKKLTDSELKKWVFKLGVPLTDPPRKLKGVELTPQQYQKMRKIAGERFTDVAGNLVRSPLFDMPGRNNLKASAIKDVWAKANREAKDRMEAEITAQVIQKQQEEAKKMMQ